MGKPGRQNRVLYLSDSFDKSRRKKGMSETDIEDMDFFFRMGAGKEIEGIENVYELRTSPTGMYSKRHDNAWPVCTASVGIGQAHLSANSYS